VNRAVAALALLASLLGLTLAAVPASAATASRAASVLAVAETRAGDWYVYGAAGPSAFDCSGLVMWAERQEGISLPHSTYAMLASGLLVPTWHPAAGDLAFYGTGHVELVARGHDVTFGALNTGTRVGMHPWNGYWHPTMYFEVR
jgi:cell wall-associated NlpC family hydrolase